MPTKGWSGQEATVDADVKRWPSSFDRLDHLDMHAILCSGYEICAMLLIPT